MTRCSLRSGLAILALAGLLTASLPIDTWARAGGGSSSGSRGSRSFSSPSRTTSAPAPSPSTRQSPAPAPAPMTQPAPAGGFLRSMAGGIVGGLLGGMLFRSLGFAGGTGGTGGGGFGLMELLLLAGIAYLIYWFVRRARARQVAALAGGPADRSMVEPYAMGGAAPATLDAPAPSWQQDLDRGLGHLRQMDPGFDEAAFRELCTDRFFQIQAAWMRRDLDTLRPLLTEEIQGVFGTQIEAARAKRQINKLENITVRSVELTEAWQEQGQDYITVRLLANLLDYTVDETTGTIVTGSDSAPVKFEEFWTWVRPVGRNTWRLGAINQAA
ncbi:MAG: TIM44-like domain-containing protein [candidate division NC10 bacterium]